jgi:hypothetical protein
MDLVAAGGGGEEEGQEEAGEDAVAAAAGGEASALTGGFGDFNTSNQQATFTWCRLRKE